MFSSVWGTIFKNLELELYAESRGTDTRTSESESKDYAFVYMMRTTLCLHFADNEKMPKKFKVFILVGMSYTLYHKDWPCVHWNCGRCEQ